jgi:hypothetical protein
MEFFFRNFRDPKTVISGKNHVGLPRKNVTADSATLFLITITFAFITITTNYNYSMFLGYTYLYFINLKKIKTDLLDDFNISVLILIFLYLVSH